MTQEGEVPKPPTSIEPTPQALPAPTKPRRKKDDDELDVAPLFEYLKSAQGHEIVSRIVGLIEGLKKATLDKNADLSTKQLDAAQKHRRNTQILQGMSFLGVLIASCVLVSIGKFDPTIGVLFGTILGYIFGKRAGLDL